MWVIQASFVSTYDILEMFLNVLQNFRELLTSAHDVSGVTFITVIFWLECKKERRKVEELQTFGNWES